MSKELDELTARFDRQLERRAIDACDHSRATVEDRDGIWSPDGERQIGVREFIECPDCPLSDWFEVDAKKED